jgi:hypothetical protein
MSERNIYSEAEAAKILEKAARLQERLDPANGSTPGVTLDELKRMAQECGISVAAVEQALIAPEDKTRSGFMNLSEEQERVFEGELDENNMADVIDSVMPVAKMAPILTMGKTYRFQVSSGMIFGQLTLSSRNGRTRLTFRQVPFIAYFVGMHLPLILSIVGGASFLAHGRIVLGLSVLFGLLAIGMFLFTTLAKVGKRKARELVDRMSENIAESLARNETSVRDALKASQPQDEVEEDQLDQGN